jgi:hypothetical protein
MGGALVPTGDNGDVKRVLIRVLAKADEALDEVLYRPAVVKAFIWLPRWWLCDLAKLSIALDDRWQVGYWDEDGIFPGGPCEACGRRASIHVLGGLEPDEEAMGWFLESRPVSTCGWCHLGTILNEADLERELALARADSVAWRWTWRVRT